MKTFICAFIVLCCIHSLGQYTIDGKVRPFKEKESFFRSVEFKKKVEDKTNERISFVVSIGVGAIDRDLYRAPIIDETDSTVIISKAPKSVSNISFGIVYTPFFFEDKDGDEVPRGWSIATFINPITLAKKEDTNTSFFESPDFGMGIGWRTFGGFSFFLTADYAKFRQPNKDFREKYKGEKYEPGGIVQSTFDPDNKNIFENVPYFSFGIKACYTFDIISSYQKLEAN